MDLFLTVLYIFNLLCILSVIFVERKRSQTTIAWVAVMSFLPIIGSVFYLAFGNTVIPPLSRQTKKHFKYFDYYKESFNRYLFLNKYEILKDEHEITKKYSDLIMLNINQNGSLYSDDNTITLFTTAKEKYESLYLDIENAKYTINIEYFIIRNDLIGKKLVALLAKKASQGVIVNLIYDELGSFRTTMKLFQPIIEVGGNVCRFYSSIYSNIIRFNNRNHRKIVVIDGKIAYTGGMNIGLEYMGKGRISPWRDTHIKIVGSAVYSLQVNFLLDFISSFKKDIEIIDDEEYFKYFPDNQFSGKSGVQIVSSGPDTKSEAIKNGYIKMINSAKKTIFIHTPYFVPDEALLESLKLAALSGIDVRFILPGTPDKNYVYYITLSYVEELMKVGVQFYLYNGFIHSKLILIDSSICSIGTTNLDARSFALNYEINAFIYDDIFTKHCEEAFIEDLHNSQLIDLQSFQKRNPLKKILESILRLFSPIA